MPLSHDEAFLRMGAYIRKWRRKTRSPAVCGFGFVSPETLVDRAIADGPESVVEVTDDELAEYIRRTWRHRQDLAINPDDLERPVCVVLAYH